MWDDKQLEYLIIHDLRNPAASILGSIQLFLDGSLGQLSPEQQKFISNLGSGATKLANILAELQIINFIETGKQDLLVETFPLQAVIDRPFLEAAAQRENKQLILNCDLATTLQGDKTLLKLIFSDLI